MQQGNSASDDDFKGAEFIDISVLGGFSISVDGRLVTGLPVGSQRLLVFLALHDRTVSRGAVAALGYRPNAAARALKSGSARTIVLVVPDGSDPIYGNPFFGEYVSAIEARARERGYALYTTASGSEPEELLSRFHEFSSRQVDGVLIFPGDIPLNAALLDSVGLPWIELNMSRPSRGIAGIGTDLRRGAYAATTHLLQHSYASVGYVGSADSADSAEPRYLGWLEACADAQIVPGPFIGTEITRPGGYHAGQKVADLTERPSALFIASDRTAVGVLRAFLERGIRVPDDIAIASFDGSWEGEYSAPALTSFRQPVEDMAAAAVTRLLAWTGERNYEIFEGRLVIRESCGHHDEYTWLSPRTAS